MKRIIVTHLDFRHPTSEDWYPKSYASTVEVRLASYEFPDKPEETLFRMSFWGNDDLGLDKEIVVPRAEKLATLQALTAFMLNLPRPLTREWLYTQGFNNA